MAIVEHKRAVGVFSNRREAEQALYELRDSGFPMDKVSVITQDKNRTDRIADAEVKQPIGDKSDEGAALGAVSGGALGGLTGLLVGLGLLAIPGIGPIMLAGATATTIATTLAGAGIGAAAGSLLGALVGLGIPEDRARVYQERLERGEYLIIVDGTDTEIARAEQILHRRGIQEYGVYQQTSEIGTPNYVSTTTPANAYPQTGFGANKYAVAHVPFLTDVESVIRAFVVEAFPLNQLSIIGVDVPQVQPFTGIATSDRYNARELGIPEEADRFYNERIKHGEYLVIVSGSEQDMARADSILRTNGLRRWDIYDPNQHPSFATNPNLR